MISPATAFDFPNNKNKKRVIFFGDSITQAAIQPKGYITILNQKLQQAGKEGTYELIGAGISGNKVPDLQKRLKKDVLSLHPDLVFIYIGINDVWHAVLPGTGGGTPITDFESGLIMIVNQIKQAGAEVVICTPSVIGEKYDGSNAQDQLLDQYAAVSRKVAETTGSQLCDLRKAFILELQRVNTLNQDQGIFTTDGVHPNEQGNALVAAQMMQYLL